MPGFPANRVGRFGARAVRRPARIGAAALRPRVPGSLILGTTDETRLKLKALACGRLLRRRRLPGSVVHRPIRASASDADHRSPRRGRHICHYRAPRPTAPVFRPARGQGGAAYRPCGGRGSREPGRSEGVSRIWFAILARANGCWCVSGEGESEGVR